MKANRNHSQTKRQSQAKTAAIPKTILYILDTNVLLHDPTCLYRFQEHDIHVPLPVLEELDNCKKGFNELSRNAREVARTLDKIVAGREKDVSKGVPLERVSGGQATGHLVLHLTAPSNQKLDHELSRKVADNKILKLAAQLREITFPGRKVVLVTKDTILRLKAIAINLEAEDYRNDHIVADGDLLRPGVIELPNDFWETHSVSKSSHERGHQFWEASGPALQNLVINDTLEIMGPKGETALYAVHGVNEPVVTFSTITDYTKEKNSVWGCTARNREQSIALNLLMNPEINHVTLIGAAGTGKTLLALAAGLQQVLKDERYSAITVIRETMPIGKEVGFIPGDENDKLRPWLGAIWDNLEVLESNAKEKNLWDKAQIPLRSAIETRSLSFVRGRSFFEKFILIDESQNLTPHQVKTLVTRIGPRSKIIFLGNLAQIDTPYLTEGSCGLAYLVNQMRDYPHGGHIILKDCERSELADYANTVL